VRLSDSTSNFLSSKRRNSESKLAHVHEQSKFTRSGSFVAAGRLYWWPDLGSPSGRRGISKTTFSMIIISIISISIIIIISSSGLTWREATG